MTQTETRRKELPNEVYMDLRAAAAASATTAKIRNLDLGSPRPCCWVDTAATSHTAFVTVAGVAAARTALAVAAAASNLTAPGTEFIPARRT